jgi:hypothetical protein
VKCFCIAATVISFTLPAKSQIAAFAITRSRCLMPWEDGRVERAVEASVGLVLSIVRRMRREEGARGRVEREVEVGCVGERTQAMRVWFGRER